MSHITKSLKGLTLIAFVFLIQANVFGQTVYDFPYTGTYSTVTLQPGNYKLEVWGAEGGINTTNGSSVSGKGGYSKGTLNLNASTIAYIFVGGKGIDSNTSADQNDDLRAGGFNGGGSGIDGGAGGGGASDIRLLANTVYDRVIVAGGAGGVGYNSGQYPGGYGGGESGGGVTSYSSLAGATQTTGHALGQGQDHQSPVNKNDSGGGGGGFYGGFGGGPHNTPGTGGSGYVYTLTSEKPGGYNLGSQYYLTNTSLIAGNASMPNPDGGANTIGRSGNGYARITQLSSGGTISSATSVFCTSSTDPDAFTSTAAANGGSGAFSYQWQVSTDGTNYNDISGATSLTYDPGVISQTTYYRRKATNNLTLYSNVLTLEKFEIDTHPSITDQTLATGANSTDLGVVVSNISDVSYQWYRNASNSNTGGTSISGANSDTFTPPTDTVSKWYYYVVVTKGGCSITSNVSGAVTVGRGMGNLTIVESGGDNIGTNWIYDNGVLTTTNSTATVNASVVEGYLLTSDLSVEAANITIDTDLTSTSANNLTLKSKANISQNTGTSVTTNNGNVILWADSDANNEGYIELGNNATINTANGSTTSGLTGGGHIVLSGGADDGANEGTANDGIPDGYASNSTGVGVNLGTTNANTTQMYSGGGDIIIRGKSTKTGGSNVDNIGLFQYGILNANSGTGSIVLFGSSTAFYGINFTEPVTNQPIGTKQLTLSSAKTSGDAIVINGTSGTNYGVVFNYENPKELLATGGGNISISGTAGGNYGIFLQNQDILASGGTVTLDGGSKGIRSTQYGARFGARSGTGITSSTANIRILGDILTFDALASGFTHTVSTTGTLTIQPSGNSFSSALSWPITNFNVNSGITGLTIGKPTNSSNVTIASAQSVAGSITLYGGDLVINESITATAEGADILLKGSADIVVAGSKSLITNGGDVIFWADSDGDGDGYINIDGDIATNGGGVWIGGSYGSNSTGSDSWIPAVGASPVTVGDGYAVTDGGNNIFGVLLDTNSSINSGGGNISIFGYGDQYYDAGSHRYSGGITLSGSIINSGIGSIFIEGEVKPDEPLGADVEWASGVMIHSNSSITSSTGSITLSGSSNLNDYQYVAGLWLGSILWNNSATGDVTISSNSGNILLDGVSKYNVSRNSFRHGLVLKTTGNIGDNISISTNSGSVNLNGETGYAGENKYNKGLYLSSNDTDSKIAITSQSGVINLKGINNGNDGANQVAVEFEAGNAPNQIRIGYDGTNAYTGNIRIQGNSLKQTTSLSSEGSISLQTTGNLTIEPVGNSFTMLNLAGTDGALTFDNDWNFSSTLSGLTIGKSTNTSDVTIGSAIDISGPITVYGSNIAINEDLDTQNGSANGDISLKASNNIVLAANKSITTDGGDVMFWSDSDASGTTTTAGGTIALLDASSINTAGGNITLAGGSDDGGALAGLSGLTASDGIPDGYAIGAYGMTAHGAVNATAGLTLDKAIINAGTGNVILRGQGTGNATNFQMGTRLYGGSITAKDISIDAIGSIQGSSSSSWGLSLEGFSLQGSGNIKLSGKGGRAGVSNSDSNQAGVEIRAAMDNTTQHAQVRATGNGTILIKGTGGSGSLSTSNNLQATGIRILSGQTNPILSESGSITLEGTSGYSGGGPGILIQSPISSTNGAINLKANPSTEGTLNQNGNIEIQSTVTTGGNLTVESLGAVTQTAAITANGLGLNGTGNFTLTNASNNVTTIAGGDNSTRLGSLRFTDATGGLTVGSVNPTGINSSGAIEIATISGDLLVTEPIVSTLSTGDAVKLYADKDAAAGELGDGQIKMSLNGVVTVESGARALLYSGKELESTGVKTALGGEANIRYEVDANTNLSTLDPAISATGSFGLFRIDNLIDLTVTSQDLVVTKLYDGTNTTSVTNVIVSGVESGDEVTVSGTATYDNTNVGSGKTITVIYTLSGNDANKYRAIPNFTTNTGEITQKAIEITAASDIKVFDGVALTKNNSSISGGSLVNSQTYTVTLTGSQTNVGSSNNVASNAVIKDSSDNDVTANYNITYVNGSLEVTKLDITIIPTASQSKTYGEVNTPLTYTINPSTLPNGTTITLGGTLSRTLGENVGTYSITLGTVSNTNYNITLSPETFAINKKTITVSGITAGDKVYDANTTSSLDLSGITFTGKETGDTITVTVTGTFDTKDIGTAKTVSLSATYSSSALDNYTIVDQSSTTASITAKTVSVTGSTGINKTYDGNTNLPLGVIGYGSLTGVIGSEDVTLSGVGVYDAASVGSRTIAIGTVTLTGADKGNYSLNWTNGSGTISKKTLTVTANNDAKFVGESDTPAYNGVSYSGFEGSDSVSDINVSGLAITRSNSSQNDAGSYPGTLVPSGVTASNYDISYVNGDYTIIPADKLLLKVTNQTTTYGTSATYTITSAQYYKTGTGLVNLTVPTPSAGVYPINDGASTINIQVQPASPINSTAGKLAVGSYGLRATVVSGSSGNFSNNIEVIGSHSVAKKSLTATASGVSKVYDATTAMNGVSLGLNGLETADVVTVNGTGSFSSPNAGTDLSYTIAGLSLAGADADNYYLSAGASFSGTNGVITKAPLTVTANNDNGVDTDPAYSGGNGVAYTGFKGLDGVSDLGGTLSYTGSSQGATSAGTYTIVPGGLTSSNYSITFVAGTLTIIVGDSDGDGVRDPSDNCPTTPNADQADADGDGIGDVCDNAPGISNPDQRDTDADGIGDVADPDDDNDGCPDTSDAFPLDPSECSDNDGDGIGDNADTDDDNDGVLDTVDNCAFTSNADQSDIDADGIGDVCDTDIDGDGWANEQEQACGSDPTNTTDTLTDFDRDGLPDCSDPDDDNDGYLDTNDAFPLDPNEWIDTDADGTGNNADTDDDNDGQSDEEEIFCGTDPLDASSFSGDIDADGITDCRDTDNDNDGVNDASDAFPLDPAEWTDTDADGIGNNADEDDDNDGYSDLDELECNSNPLDANELPADLDADGVPDCKDTDIDGDGCINTEDVFPRDPSECQDTDGDGLGDNVDVDDDADGVIDSDDAFPLDPRETKDSDGDGIGDNADPDDNNDGFDDEKVLASGVLTPNSSGMESTWKIINIEQYPNARVSVFDKNGMEVFRAQAYKNDWRGTYKNSADPLPAGSYYYVVELNTGEEPITGWLYITY